MGKTVIGIDLGTTTTEAAVYRDGKVEMILNYDGSIVTPSAVGLDETGNMIVGQKARAQYMLSPERTAIEVKRKIGSGEGIRLGKETFSALDLSAQLLSYVKRYASEYLGKDVSNAVISVPAYFDDIQRQEVMEAGRRAGFTVERIINEPTAAAMSYGVEHMDEESHILVYDLGGGTFDVTLLEMFEGVLEVKASSGDNKLGGKDFDERLIGWLRAAFEKENGTSIERDVYAMARLKDAAERCKCELSGQERASVRIPMLTEKNHVPLGLEADVSREKFEELISDLVERTHRPINVVLADSGLSSEDISMVLLVGGSTRIPVIARDIEEFLGITPRAAVDPDYCVAQGAAVCAAVISGTLDGEDALVMTDVNPYTLGIRTSDGYYNNDIMSVIIHRNVTIPTTKSDMFSTAFPGQTTVNIDVYQGESDVASENHFLGNFVLRDIPENRRELERIDVSFTYNLNGMLEVSATVLSTGEKAGLEIDMANSQAADLSDWREAECAGEYRSVIRRAQRRLDKLQDAGDDEVSEKRLENLIYRLKGAILNENRHLADDVADNLEDLLEDLS